MTTLDYSSAIDEIFGTVNAANNANAAAIIGYVPKLYWPGVIEPSAPDLSKFWARASQQTVEENQLTLAKAGEIKYHIDGLIFVQCFLPAAIPTAMQTGRVWAAMIKNALRGHSTSGGIWFRRAKIQELPTENSLYRLNVIAEYQYDEIG